MRKFNVVVALFTALVLVFGFASCKKDVEEKPVNYSVTKIDGEKSNPDSFLTISLTEYKGKKISVAFTTKMLVINKSETDANLMWQINAGNSNYPVIASKIFEPGVSKWVTVSGTKTGDDAIELGSGAYFYLSTNQITPADFIIFLKDFSLIITPENEDAVSYSISDISAKEESITKLSDSDAEAEAAEAVSKKWLSDSVPSIYETYKDQFDYIGIAAEYGNFGLKQTGSNKYTATYTWDGSNWSKPTELYYEEIQNGIAKHANSITLGNELKPQFVLGWWNNGDGAKQTMVDFTGSNGKTIKVPNKLGNENLIYATLTVCKKMGVQMRGHVLTWHSQTPDDLFAEGYNASVGDDGLLTNPVDKETMTARHEWYIKSVLECVANWESANGYGTGNHIIWAWDVVNEATADDAGQTYTGDGQNWLRGSTDGTKDKSPANSGSRWFQIYGDEEFIVNAFRFANAYAPSDVKLCYNDYNEYMEYGGGYKTSAICKLLTSVKEGEAQTINGNSVAPRIDVMAMQSHVGVSWPGVDGYETALKRYLALGLDVHVSELDFSAETQEAANQAYAQYFTMLQKYGKKYSGTNKVTCITIWGINNESSWINPASSGGKKTYPLLFNLVDNVTTTTKTVIYDTGKENLPQYDIGDTYEANAAFYTVIDAHN